MRGVGARVVSPGVTALPPLTRPAARPGSSAHLAGLSVVAVVGLLTLLTCELASALPQTYQGIRLRWEGAPATAAVTDTWTTRHGARTCYHVRYVFTPGPPGTMMTGGEDSLEPDQSARLAEAVALGQVPVRYLPSDPSVNAVDDAISEKDTRAWVGTLVFAAVAGFLAFLLRTVARSMHAERRAGGVS
jgi:hypothetical protein